MPLDKSSGPANWVRKHDVHAWTSLLDDPTAWNVLSEPGVGARVDVTKPVGQSFLYTLCNVGPCSCLSLYT
ncbi:hypothetical protein PG995_012063 [Apiospora arundinis]